MYIYLTPFYPNSNKDYTALHLAFFFLFFFLPTIMGKICFLNTVKFLEFDTEYQCS